MPARTLPSSSVPPISSPFAIQPPRSETQTTPVEPTILKEFVSMMIFFLCIVFPHQRGFPSIPGRRTRKFCC